MDIPQKIDAIIAERKKQLPKIAAALDRIMTAKEMVEDLERRRTGSDEFVGSMMRTNPDFKEKLEEIPTREFYDRYMTAERLLRDLQKRFDRDEIHISFVGRAGQGKSLILQRISGLSGSIIPSADGGDCTGTKSVISNSPGEATKAEITFYTEQEFVGIVNKYLEEIFKTKELNVYSVDGISRLKGRELKVDFTQVREQSYLTHLKKYIDHAESLKGQLGTRITVPEQEIEPYVAQYKSDDKETKYFNYLAVKEARIIASFPCAQCGKIVLEDTIGTGATSLGVDDAMLHTVKQDSDVIVYMMRPEPLRPRLTKEDYDMISEIKDAVTPEYARQMLFWLVNRVDEGKAQNASQVPEIMSQLHAAELPVAQYLNVNCWKQEEVDSEFLQPVLTHMSEHLAEIDNLLLTRANAQLKELEAAYRGIYNRLEKTKIMALGENIYHFDENYIKPLWRKVTNALRDLTGKYDQKRNEPCALLEDAAAVKLKNILLAVPSKEEIVIRLEDGTINQHNALEEYSNKLRMGIIDDFLGLNPVLHDLVTEMKKEIVYLLADDSDAAHGRLKFVVNIDQSDPDIWLTALLEKVSDDPKYQTICSALRPLIEFDLSMENFLIYNVRCCLDPIVWSKKKNPPAIRATVFEKDELADEIQFWLRDLLSEVHEGIRKELRGYYQFPNTALYAVVTDFYDRIAYAVDDENREAKTAWSYFYKENAPIIWAEEDREYKLKNGIAREWDDFVEKFKECSVNGYLLIK